MKSLIPRKAYTERFMPFLGSRVVKVVTGMRRCGKSSFLRLFMEHLTKTGICPHKSIIYIDMESFENAGIATVLRT